MDLAPRPFAWSDISDKSSSDDEARDTGCGGGWRRVLGGGGGGMDHYGIEIGKGGVNLVWVSEAKEKILGRQGTTNNPCVYSAVSDVPTDVYNASIFV